MSEQNFRPELFIVVGPNGSGKSSAIYETKIADEIIFVNPDDIAAEEFSHVSDTALRDKLAWLNCNAKRESLLTEGMTFGFETVGSHPSKVEFIQNARDLGYKVTLLFVATEDPAINIRRIAERHAKGGHTVPDQKVIERYYRTLDLLKDYFRVADDAFVWDNSIDSDGIGEAGIVELVRKVGFAIEILPAASDVKWVNTYLIGPLCLRDFVEGNDKDVLRKGKLIDYENLS